MAKLRQKNHTLPPDSPLREVLFEFWPVGAYVKVSAIDPDTLIEVSIVGDASRSQAALERVALRKLEYAVRRHLR